MIKVSSMTLNHAAKEAEIFAMADDKSEVDTATLSDYKGLPEGYSIAFGSKLLTTYGEVAIMKSDGTWNWG